MKILITCLSHSWGGLEMYSLTTAVQLKKREFEVEMLACRGSRLESESASAGIKTHAVSFSNYFHPVETLKLALIVKRSSYNIIHSEASKDLWILVPAIKIARSTVPLIFSKHMGSFIVKKDFLHKLLYRRVTVATAISKVIRKNLLDTTPLKESQIKLLYNGIDTGRFDPEKIDGSKVRNEFGLKENELLIGMIARFSRGKGHEEFLKAAREIAERHTNIKFIIVGEPSKGEDNYAAEIKSLAAELGIIDKIIFTGFRKDTPEILAAMDLFIFPSHAEAFGIALVEAMSMQKPSVCSASDGVLDIAIDGETSLLFRKQDYKDLAAKMEILINDPGARQKMGLAARKRAVEVFDIEIFTDKLIEIYSGALAG